MVVARAAAARATLALSAALWVGCVSGDIPPRPLPQPSQDVNLVWPSAGCGKDLPAEQPMTIPGSPTGYLQYHVMQTGKTLGAPVPDDAGDRTFWVRVPANYDKDQAYRVVYVGMDCGPPGTANVNALPLYSEDLGGTEQAIYVAIDPPWSSIAQGQSCYDTGTSLESQEWEAFDLYERAVDANYCVDENRIFIAGLGSSAALANMYGCFFAGLDPKRTFAPGVRIRGQASLDGQEPLGDPACNGPVAAMFIVDSSNVGELSRARDRVLAQNGCVGSPTTPWSLMSDVCVQFTGCPKEFPVVSCTTDMAGMDAQQKRAISGFRDFFDLMNPTP